MFVWDFVVLACELEVLRLQGRAPNNCAAIFNFKSANGPGHLSAILCQDGIKLRHLGPEL